MADVEDDRSIASSEGSGGANVDEDNGVDADFGAIEMFDSNSAPTSFSSQAPEAIMTENAPMHSSSRKSKRDKKEKRDKKRRASLEGAALSSSVAEAEGHSARKHRKSKKKSTRDVEVPDSQLSKEEAEPAADTPWGQLQEEAAAASKKKKKRKLSDSADGKRRKKHRSRDQDSKAPSGEEERRGSQEAGATSFLHKGKDKRGVPESAVFEDNEPGSDPQASPTVAHLRRRSQSREARSRENSVPVSAPMDVDVAATTGLGQAATGATADTDYEAERIAREAWNEHRNGQQSQDEVPQGDHDTDMPDQYLQEPLRAGADTTAEAQLASPQQKRSRSTRKKAKPTFFERPSPEILDDDNNGLAELPSPSAMTPKPRNRTKRAAKKESRGRKPKRERLSQSMRGGSVDAENGEGGAGERRNRLTGYTQGRFSDAELARISRAVESFREDNGLTQQEVNEVSATHASAKE